MKRLTKEILDELVAKGLIENYVLTEHYAVHKYSEEVRRYLLDQGITTDGESRNLYGGAPELKIYYLWW